MNINRALPAGLITYRSKENLMAHDCLFPTDNDNSRSPIDIKRYLQFAVVVVVMLLLRTESAAQNVQYNNQSMDLGMRGTLKVNPSTRGMELQIPLGHYRGRGLDVPLTLSYSSKLWGVEFQGYNT